MQLQHVYNINHYKPVSMCGWYVFSMTCFYVWMIRFLNDTFLCVDDTFSQWHVFSMTRFLNDTFLCVDDTFSWWHVSMWMIRFLDDTFLCVHDTFSRYTVSMCGWYVFSILFLWGWYVFSMTRFYVWMIRFLGDRFLCGWYVFSMTRFNVRKCIAMMLEFRGRGDKQTRWIQDIRKCNSFGPKQDSHIFTLGRCFTFRYFMFSINICIVCFSIVYSVIRAG